MLTSKERLDTVLYVRIRKSTIDMLDNATVYYGRSRSYIVDEILNSTLEVTQKVKNVGKKKRVRKRRTRS